MITVLDVENTVTTRNGKMHLDPFEPDNQLVMVGMLSNDNEVQVTFDHSDIEPTVNGHNLVQKQLDETTLLVCHNASHDLLWLWESGFTYDGSVWDTMLAEYVMLRGIKKPLSLEACAERYNLNTMKQDTLKNYLKQGVSVRDIPHDELSMYLSADIHATYELFEKQHHSLTHGNEGLMSTVEFTNDVCLVLSRIYQNGFCVDKNALDAVRNEFEQEKLNTEKELQNIVHKIMGDTPINLNSPEQLSQVIFSRRVRNKSLWKEQQDPYMSKEDYKEFVRMHTDSIHRTEAVRCPQCEGKGKVRKTKKDGTPYARTSKCDICAGDGYLYRKTKDIAGLKLNPPSPKWFSANGFSTSKQNLEILENAARVKNLTIAVDFLSKVRRLSALDSYLSSFVDGITAYTKHDSKLHVRLLQHRTATGRFSGADPNMQNMPRGKTFPVKKVFVSRFDGGKILEADFAQLEFRAAAFLSQDETAMEEVRNGFDVHSYTAKIITEAGQPTDRQTAKAHTFAPLYGATGFGRTPAEAAYYEHFTEKYRGITRWHTELAREALADRKIRIPSGREYAFPDVVRKFNGTVTNFTQIKNYPVQGFATADIVPLTLIKIHKELQSYKSCIVNTVHDSIVIDVHPNEEKEIIQLIKRINTQLKDLIKDKWCVNFNVPLLLESKIGDNWLDTKDVA